MVGLFGVFGEFDWGRPWHDMIPGQDPFVSGFWECTSTYIFVLNVVVLVLRDFALEYTTSFLIAAASRTMAV
jgi:hypothetical protein